MGEMANIGIVKSSLFKINWPQNEPQLWVLSTGFLLILRK
jgi:hypothetical protein